MFYFLIAVYIYGGCCFLYHMLHICVVGFWHIVRNMFLFLNQLLYKRAILSEVLFSFIKIPPTNMFYHMRRNYKVREV